MLFRRIVVIVKLRILNYLLTYLEIETEKFITWFQIRVTGILFCTDYWRNRRKSR